MSLKNKVLIVLLIAFVSYLGNVFTSTSVNTWYLGLNLPSWTPPGAFIGIVWTIIYILLAVSIISVFSKYTNTERLRFIHIKRWFLINLILNLLWSFVFIANKAIFAGILVAALLTISVYILIYLIRPVSRWSAVALYPYAIWTTFATILNIVIWTLN